MFICKHVLGNMYSTFWDIEFRKVWNGLDDLQGRLTVIGSGAFRSDTPQKKLQHTTFC